MIFRDYQCLDCEREFEVECESGDMPDPDCPYCNKVLDWVPGMFSVKTNKSRAMDLTQKIVEEDYGLSDLNDRNREGDIAFKAPVESAGARDERIKMEHEIAEMAAAAKLPPANENAVNGFWGGQQSGAPANTMVAQTLIASGKTGPASDVNPMRMLHDGIKSGQIPRSERIIARWRP